VRYFVLTAFTGAGGDGANPQGELAALSGAVYGTTFRGGIGAGIVFEVRKDGRVRIVHTLKQSEGTRPLAGLTAFDGALYGVTTKGGSKLHGTVFELSP
jgi:uncharacterized repeat protein (TIGR03803 family)